MEGVPARDPETAYLTGAYVAGDMTKDEVIAALDRRYKPQPASKRLERAMALADAIGPSDPGFDMKTFTDEM